MMTNILSLRDFLIRLYRRCDFVLVPLIKFLLSFLVLTLLQARVGYFDKLSGALIISIFSLIAAFFPPGCISFIAGLYLTLDMLEVSYIMAAVGAGVLILILLLYYGFRPGTGIVVTLVPLACFLRVPLLVPVILGLTIGIYSVIPALSGVLCYQLVKYFSLHAGELSTLGTDEIADSFLGVIRGVLLDRYMICLMGAFAAGIIIAAVVSRLSVRFARLSAAASSVAVGALIILFADIRYSGSVGWDMAGALLSLALAVFYVLVFYAADYRGIERLEFEDDDYFYFVKAIPKIKASDPEDYI